jgi:hypothetical protein
VLQLLPRRMPRHAREALKRHWSIFGRRVQSVSKAPSLEIGGIENLVLQEELSTPVFATGCMDNREHTLHCSAFCKLEVSVKASIYRDGH